MGDKSPRYRVKVNEFEFELGPEDVAAADIIPLSATDFHLISEHRSVMVSLKEEVPAEGKMTLEIEGETYQALIADELHLLLDRMGYGAAAAKQVKEIKAPMPGLVLDVSVTTGQSVRQGDRLLILVAMKMENSIVIPADAVIKNITVKAGQAVEKGQLLIELE